MAMTMFVWHIIGLDVRMNANDLFFGFEWYLDCKDKALQEIIALRVPCDQRLARLAYGSYFVNLVSITEAVIEKIDTGKSAVEATLDGIGGLTGENNYGYIKELRNGIVHRGLDPAASGMVHGDRILMIAPKELTSGRGKKSKTYQRFLVTIDEMVILCELKIGPAIDYALNSCDFWSESRTEEDLRDEVEAFIENAEHMPLELKPMAKQTLMAIDFSLYREQARNQLRRKLMPNDVSAILGFELP